MKSGVLNLKKTAGMTSHDAVFRVRKLFGTKKVGHTGTLDPNATGVLPLLVGGAVKASEFLLNAGKKTYVAGIRFGLFTDTEDIWGKTVSLSEKRVSEEEFSRAMNSFLGTYLQVPPMVSAIKIGGKKLYEYAREGKVIPREAREVFVHSFRLISFSEEEALVEATVSKGTYIRTLIYDLCKRCGIEGVMNSLERRESGGFCIEGAVTLDELEQMEESEREEMLVPTENLFLDFAPLRLPEFYLKLCKSGCRIDVKKIGLSEEKLGTRFRLLDEKGFFALGEIKEYHGVISLEKIKEFPREN